MSRRRRHFDNQPPPELPAPRFNRMRYDDVEGLEGDRRLLRNIQALRLIGLREAAPPFNELHPPVPPEDLDGRIMDTMERWGPPISPPPSNLVAAALQGLVDDWRSVLANKDLADFTIKCGPTSIKVHSLVLAVRSPVFKAMLQHDTVETRNREVIIDDMESDTLEAMLEYMYCSKVKLDDVEFNKACQLAAAADKYGLIELKDACFQHLFKDINLQNAGDLMILARRCSGPKEFLKKALDFCTKNFKDLRKDPEFKDVMKECLDEFFVPENN